MGVQSSQKTTGGTLIKKKIFFDKGPPCCFLAKFHRHINFVGVVGEYGSPALNFINFLVIESFFLFTGM